MGLRFIRLEITHERSLHPKHWSLALPRSRQLPSCVTAYPRGSRSRVFVLRHFLARYQLLALS